MEQACIRWLAANMRLLGYFSNFILLACFHARQRVSGPGAGRVPREPVGGRWGIAVSS